LLKDYPRALADFDRALELRPHYASILAERGLTCLWMRDLRQAILDYTPSREIDYYYLQNHNNWMAIWSGMFYERPGLEVIEQLEIIAATDPTYTFAFVCRGVAMWLRRDFEGALKELEQAIQMAPEEWDAYFWKGLTYASLGHDEEALAAVERSLELELPPILLTPLRWFEQDRPDFYQKYVVPLMARYDLE
jgi:tetratricopeptide (TPR) repeat protein